MTHRSSSPSPPRDWLRSQPSRAWRSSRTSAGLSRSRWRPIRVEIDDRPCGLRDLSLEDDSGNRLERGEFPVFEVEARISSAPIGSVRHAPDSHVWMVFALAGGVVAAPAGLSAKQIGGSSTRRLDSIGQAQFVGLRVRSPFGRLIHSEPGANRLPLPIRRSGRERRRRRPERLQWHGVGSASRAARCACRRRA